MITINKNLADQLKLKEGDSVTATQGASKITLPLKIDDRLASDLVFIPSGTVHTQAFGQNDAPVSLEKEAR